MSHSERNGFFVVHDTVVMTIAVINNIFFIAVNSCLYQIPGQAGDDGSVTHDLIRGRVTSYTKGCRQLL